MWHATRAPQVKPTFLWLTVVHVFDAGFDCGTVFGDLPSRI